MPLKSVFKSRGFKLFLSYAPDWFLSIALAAVFFSLNNIQGVRRDFSLSDISLRHPYALKETVPDTSLYLIAVVAPLVLQPLINLASIRSYWDFHSATLGVILALSLTGSVTQIIKITTGRPRPDVIARCQPPAGSIDPPFGLVDHTICTQTNAGILTDGFRSFPSAHASLSFAGLGFLSFYLAGKLHLFDHRGHTGKAWISLTPLAGATLVAISRTKDYRHHWQDVLIGGILGITLAYFSYRQYYPPLESNLSHKPYSPRIKREGTEVIDVGVERGHEDDGLPLHNRSTRTDGRGSGSLSVDGSG